MPFSQTAPRAASTRLRAEELESRLAPAITVRFDYSYDQFGFFSDPEPKAALQRAATAIGSRLADNLSAIVPSGSNTWQASFFNPITGETILLDNPTIRENEIVVFVAGAPLSGSELGLATTGGFSATGSRAWLDTVRARGQTGALAAPKSDYSTWGGMITFDTRTNWNFSTGNPASDQYDFGTVALHELMHIFGFGLGEPAFVRHVVGGLFTGPAVVAAAGAPVPVVGNPPDHWAPGVRVNGAASPMEPTLRAGEKRTLTAIDYAALDDIGWEVFDGPARPTSAVVQEESSAAPTPVPALIPVAVPTASSVVAATLPAGRAAVGTPYGAVVLGTAGEPLAALDPFAGSPGGVRVATADINGDGVPDLITGSGPGRPAVVKVYDGKTGAELVSFAPFEPSFGGGVFVAAGDFTGDGRADIVVTPDRSGGPVVAVYDGVYAAGGQVIELTRFLGIADPNFRGGARAAVGDLNRDGLPDLVVAAGAGGGPRVAVFDGRSIRGRSDAPSTLVPDFFAFEPGLRNGVYVAVADLNGDGFGELIVGAGPGGAPRVRALDGRELMAGTRATVADFFAGDPSNRGGVRVAALDLDGDTRGDIVTGAGQGGLVAVYASRDLIAGGHPPPWLTTLLPGDFPDGIYVG
jgi:hypothetical protein